MRINRTGQIPRQTNVRDSRLIVIATEGEKTEKQYLESLFDSSLIQVKVLETGPEGNSAPRYVLERLITFKQTAI